MRILIFKKEKELAPVGGSNGYCYNIYQEIRNKNISDIDFLLDESESKYASNSIKKYLSSFKNFVFGTTKIKFEDIKQYDIIHFHSSKDLYASRRILKKFKGLVIFSSHSPIPTHLEIVENIRNHHKILGHIISNHSFSYIDKYAFKRADYIIFPCEEAEESYYEHWPVYKKIHKNNVDKYRYIETGINQVVAKKSCEDYRKEFGIKDNDFVVSFVGRHNQIKGYDRLIQVSSMLESEKDIKFLIGGKQGPLFAPKNDRWIEVGWTNDPYSLINCSNVFVLPNRETYFDIILLESLCLGKTCLVANNGGNKSILKNKCSGVIAFDNEKECAELIKKLKKNRTPLFNNESRDLFLEKYSSEIFLNKYLQLLKGLYEKHYGKN